VITLNPADLTVNPNQNASFAADASSNLPETVQWQFSTDGGTTSNNVTGVTSFLKSLSLTAVTAAQGGTLYRALFTNTLGSTATSWATLTVRTTAPIGAVYQANRDGVAGWGFDADAATSAVKIRIDIDGVRGTPFDANIPHSELSSNNQIVGINHGFNFIMPHLSSSKHLVEEFVQDYPGVGYVQLGAITLPAITAPLGAIESSSREQITGVAFDPNAQATSIQVRVDVDGTAGTPFLAGINRPDLTSYNIIASPNHGFSFLMPHLSASAHTVDVYMQDYPSTTTFVKLGSKDIPAATAPIGAIELASRELISGVAFDPNADTNSTLVRVDIDGAAGTPFLADINRPDLTSYNLIGSPNHGFAYLMPHLSAASHTVDVYMQDYPGDTYVKIGTKTIAATAAPIGKIEYSGRDRIVGVAFDPNADAASIQVRIDIDGAVGTPFTANVNRPDLINYNLIGTSNHGFIFTLPTLSSATHKIDVWMQDFPDSIFVKLGTVNLAAV
jgi:hypothetical protein